MLPFSFLWDGSIEWSLAPGLVVYCYSQGLWWTVPGDSRRHILFLCYSSCCLILSSACMALPSLSLVKDRHYQGWQCWMGRSRRGRRFFLFNHPFSRVIMDWFLSFHFSHQFKLFCHLTCETIWSWVWSELCLEKLDLIVVKIFLWFFITWSSLLLIIHIHI